MSEGPASREASSGHRFAPGQEAEARAFLERPTEFETYIVIADRVALWMLFFSAPLGPMLYGLLYLGTAPSDTVGAWINLVAAAAVTLSLGGAFAFKLIRRGWFVLDPERGEMRISDQAFSFADVLDPKIRRLEHEQWSPDAGVLRGTVAGLDYRPGTVLLTEAGFSYRKLEDIATLLGKMATEFQEKEAVRRWLAERRVAAMDRSADEVESNV